MLQTLFNCKSIEEAYSSGKSFDALTKINQIARQQEAVNELIFKNIHMQPASIEEKLNMAMQECNRYLSAIWGNYS